MALYASSVFPSDTCQCGATLRWRHMVISHSSRETKLWISNKSKLKGGILWGGTIWEGPAERIKQTLFLNIFKSSWGVLFTKIAFIYFKKIQSGIPWDGATWMVQMTSCLNFKTPLKIYKYYSPRPAGGDFSLDLNFNLSLNLKSPFPSLKSTPPLGSSEPFASGVYSQGAIP